MGKLSASDVRCEADPDDDDVEIEFTKVKHVSNKAVLIRKDGEDIWLPFSQLVDFDAEAQTATVTAYIARIKEFS